MEAGSGPDEADSPEIARIRQYAQTPVPVAGGARQKQGVIKASFTQGALPQLADTPAVPVEVDRYGVDRSVSRDCRTAEEVARDYAKERERERKWAIMLRDYESFYGRRKRKVKERVKKGIPDVMRGRAWAAILGVDHVPEEVSLATCYHRRVPPDDQVIMLDVPRTLPFNPVFQTRSMQIACYRVLRAYANCDKDLGYVQGVAFHAGILLCYLDEGRAFRALYRLFMNKGIRNMFCDRFRGLLRTVACFESLLRRRLPRLREQLRVSEVAPELFAPQWFLTAFVAVDLPFWMILRIFDCFVEFGERSLVAFGLALCKCEEERLVGTLEDILPLLQKPGQRMECMSRPYRVIAEWHRQWVTEDDWRAEMRAVMAASLVR